MGIVVFATAASVERRATTTAAAGLWRWPLAADIGQHGSIAFQRCHLAFGSLVVIVGQQARRDLHPAGVRPVSIAFNSGC